MLKYCNPERRDKITFPMLLDTVTEDVEEAPYEVAPWYVLSATIKEKQSLLEDLQRVFRGRGRQRSKNGISPQGLISAPSAADGNRRNLRT